MTAPQKRVVEWSLETEIAAVVADIERTGPKKDYYGQPMRDARVEHLALCRGALSEVRQLKVST